MAKKKKYSLGEVFAIPLENYFAVGIIVRGNGPILLGYFLKEKYKDLPKLEDISFRNPKYVLIKKFGSLGLDKGHWIRLGILKDFDVDTWKVPIFKRKNSITDEYFKVFYDNNLKEINIEIAEEGENLNDYPSDGTAGYIAIEEILSDLLDLGNP